MARQRWVGYEGAEGNGLDFDRVGRKTTLEITLQMATMSAALVALIAVPAWFASHDLGRAVLTGLGIVGAYMLVMTLVASRMPLWIMGARRPLPTDRSVRVFQEVVEEISIAGGIPAPRVLVYHDSRVNAFSSGIRKRNAALAVSTGALAELNREQLEGVAAHELAHILNGDVPVRTVAFAVLEAFAALTTALWTLAVVLPFYQGKPSLGILSFIVVLVALPAWLVFWVANAGVRHLYHASCRASERRADAKAVELTRDPMGLAEAIASTMWGNRGIQRRVDPLAPLLFVPMAPRTHPAPEERIEALTGYRPARTPEGGIRIGGSLLRNPRPFGLLQRAGKKS